MCPNQAHPLSTLCGVQSSDYLLERGTNLSSASVRKAVYSVGVVLMLVSLLLGGGLVGPSVVSAAGPDIQPVITVTDMDNGVTEIAILIKNVAKKDVWVYEIFASVPEGMVLKAVEQNFSWNGTTVSWLNKANNAKDCGEFKYWVDTKGYSDEIAVNVKYTGDITGWSSETAMIGTGASAAAPMAPVSEPVAPASAPAPGDIVSSSDEAIDPIVTVEMDGDLALINVFLNNVAKKDVWVYEISSTVPDGMSLKNVWYDYKFDGVNVWWIHKANHAKSVGGFSYAVDTKGMGGVAVTTVRYTGDVTGWATVSTWIGY